MEFPEKLFSFLLTKMYLFTMQPAKFLVGDEGPNLESHGEVEVSPQVAAIAEQYSARENLSDSEKSVFRCRSAHCKSHMKPIGLDLCDTSTKLLKLQ
jgi:hypothetical protein